MLLLTRCPACDQKIKFRRSDHGRTLTCPKCRGGVETAHVTVPSADDAPPVVGYATTATRRAEDYAPATQPSVWLRDTGVGAAAGAAWGALLGVLSGCLISVGPRVGGGDEGLMFAVLVVLSLLIGTAIYAAIGAITGLVYGLTGNEPLGYLTCGGLSLTLLVATGSLGPCGGIMTIAFVVFVMRVIDYGE